MRPTKLSDVAPAYVFASSSPPKQVWSSQITGALETSLWRKLNGALGSIPPDQAWGWNRAGARSTLHPVSQSESGPPVQLPANTSMVGDTPPAPANPPHTVSHGAFGQHHFRYSAKSHALLSG